MSQRMKAPPTFWSLLHKSWQSQTKLTRERSGHHRGKTASSQNVRSRTFLSIPPSLSDHPFPNSYTMKFFMAILYSYFASICPRKIMPLFTYIQLQITAGFAMLLVILQFFPSQISSSITRLQFLWNKFSPSSVVPSSLTLWVHFPASASD